MEQLEKRQEYFEISFDIEDSRIPVGELITYLHNTEKLFKSINESLEPDKKYDKIELDVLALEKGSFIIAFVISTTSAVLGTVLGGLALNYLSRKNPPKEYKPGEEDILAALASIFDTVNNDHRITDITITYEDKDKDNNIERKKITLSKETLLENRNVYHEEVGQRVWFKEKIQLKVLSPLSYYFYGKPEVIVEFEDGKVFYAEIEDIDFIKNTLNQNIVITKDDVIIADLDCFLKQEEIGIVAHYSITKVHSCQKHQHFESLY